MCPEDKDFTAFTDDFLQVYLSKSVNVLRSYKATAAARRQRLQDELTETARLGFITAWAHDNHWDAAARALKK